MNDNPIFRTLGFEKVESIDFSDEEDPTYIHSLNCEPLKDLLNRYDVILDCGTLEHVFHLTNAFRKYTFNAKKEGRIIHFLLQGNYFNHGLYVFSNFFKRFL